MTDDASQTKTNLTSFAITNQGKVRPNNEDWVDGFIPANLVDLQNSGCLFIVADGVGGAQKGELASRFAVRNVLYEYYQNPSSPPPERLTEIIQTTGNRIYQYSVEKNFRMATTLVAAVIQGDRLTVANVGDSRAYLIRDGAATQITRDHNRAGELVRMGALTVEEARVSSSRKTLTRSPGGKPDEEVDLFKNILLQEGDTLLLCTDGLTEYAAPEDIARIVSNASLEDAGNTLVNFANDADGSDNITLYLIRYGKYTGGTGQPADHVLPEPADWDEVNTIQFVEMGKKRSRQPRKFNTRSLVLILLPAFALLIIGGTLVWALNKQKAQTASSVPGSLGRQVTSPTQTISLPAILMTDPPILPTSAPVIPDATQVQELTTTPTVEPTVVSQESAEPMATMVCVHVVEANEGMYGIFFNAGLEYQDGIEVFKYTNCKINENESFCTSEKISIQTTNLDQNEFQYLINPNDYVELQGINDKETCEEKGNRWVRINP